MKIFIPPNDPCFLCSGVIEVTEDSLICSRCDQRWFIGPEGCWGTEFEYADGGRVQKRAKKFCKE